MSSQNHSFHIVTYRHIYAIALLHIITCSVVQVDCYSFAIVLWALLSWKGPFPDMTPVQIMVAVAVHNKRPPTASLEQEWGKHVVDLMRELWSAEPSERPSIAHARDVLLKLLDELCKRGN